MKKLMMILALAVVAAPLFASTAGAENMMHRRWACFARNHRGMQFEAVSHERYRAEREALEACYRSGSRSCRLEGCRERW